MTSTFGNVRFGATANGVAPLSTGLPPAMYPAAIATNAQLTVAVDRLQTRLAVPMAATDTTMTVINGAGIVASCLLTIDNEIVQVVSGSGNTWQISRAFDGTAAALHLGSSLVSAFVDAWHHNAVVSEVQAIQTALGPNLSRVPSSSEYINTAYDFPAQSPGGNLIVGANVINLSPVPPGVNGSDTDHYLYISGGTGTAEAVLIVGGTAVSRAASGTVIVTCANAHSGAWQIRTATGGIQEAIQDIVSNTGQGKVVVVRTVTLYAPVTTPFSFIELSGHGVSYGSGQVLRADSFTTGASIHVTHGARLTIYDLTLSGNPVFSAYPCILADNNSYLTIRNIAIFSAYQGIVLDGVQQTDIDGVYYINQTTSVAKSGIQVGGTVGVTNVKISNITCVATDITKLTSGIALVFCDGAQLNHIWISASSGITVAPIGTNGVFNTYVNDFLVDGFDLGGIVFGNPVTARVTSLRFIDGHLNAQHTAGFGSNGIDLGHSFTANVDGIDFDQIKIFDCMRDGVRIGAMTTPKAIDFSGLQVCNNRAGGEAANYSGFRIANGASGIRIRNCTIGNRIPGLTGSQAFGIVAEGTCTDSMITGNDLSSNANGPIQLAGIFTGLIANNKGIDDVIPTLASGALFVFPINPHFVISGTATVTSVNMNAVPAGSGGTFKTTGAVPFTATGGIATAGTTTAGKLYVWFYDGTSMSINGSGF